MLKYQPDSQPELDALAEIDALDVLFQSLLQGPDEPVLCAISADAGRPAQSLGDMGKHRGLT